MSDQCKHCTVRGNIEKCLETNCSQHESWMVLHIAAQLTTATAKISEQSVRIEELERDKARLDWLELTVEFYETNNNTIDICLADECECASARKYKGMSLRKAITAAMNKDR